VPIQPSNFDRAVALQKKLHLIPLPGVLIDGRPLLHNREKKLTSTIATLKR